MSVAAHVDGLCDECLQIDLLCSLVGLGCQDIPCSFRFEFLRAEVRLHVAMGVLGKVSVRSRWASVFLQQSDVLAQFVLEAREIVDSFEGHSNAGVGIGRQYSHGYDDFNAIRDRGATALVVFSELTLPFLDVD